MMKKVLILMLAIMSACAVLGQEKKVAMLEPIIKGGNVTQMQKEMILGALEKAITKVPGYRAFTRLDVNQITKELSFQQSGMVNEAQRRKIGDMSGASLICISQLTAGDGTNIYIKSSLVDVESGEIVGAADKLMKKDEEAIYAGCQLLANELMGVSSTSPSSNRSQSYNTQRHPAEPEMVFVQGGTFTMGCTSEQGDDCFNSEKPAHTVTLSSYYISKYEVTQGQWKLIMGTSVSQQRDKKGTNYSLYGEGDNYPMYYVSWDEAQEFISRLNAATGKQYRLPTEAEWEYAARGGNQSRGYKYSGGNFIEQVAWYDGNSGKTTHPVGTKQPNELGIYDMSGNVYEWCYDWYGTYSASAQRDHIGASSGSDRVNRGGSWNDNAAICRVSDRYNNSPGNRNNSLGFRVACSSK